VVVAADYLVAGVVLVVTARTLLVGLAAVLLLNLLLLQHLEHPTQSQLVLVVQGQLAHGKRWQRNQLGIFTL
jgi:hypothetical protein